MAVAQAHTVCNLSVSVKQNSYLLPWVQHVRIAVPVSSCSAFPGAHSELQLIKVRFLVHLGCVLVLEGKRVDCDFDSHDWIDLGVQDFCMCFIMSLAYRILCV